MSLLGQLVLIFVDRDDHVFMTALRRDNPVNRSLHHIVGGSSNTIVETCLDTCDSLGFGFAGLEFSSECCTVTFPLMRKNFTQKDLFIPQIAGMLCFMGMERRMLVP